MQTEKQPMQIPSPIEYLEHPIPDSSGCKLYIKREDLIHPNFGGNKWRKLKYNLKAFSEGNYSHLITFGGPFSNHIAATASICSSLRIDSVGIIRGTYSDPENPTLIKAKEAGMDIRHIPKIAYSDKEVSVEVKAILAEYPSPYLIPEGGSNAKALLGVGEMNKEINEHETAFTHIIVACGTGTTAAGLIRTGGSAKVVAVNVLKNEALESTIRAQVGTEEREWRVIQDYTFGGFAKVDEPLIEFTNDFKAKYDIPLDPIYNGKAMYGCLDMMREGYFPEGSEILYVHTGGLQGITAYNYKVKVEGMRIV